MKKLDTSKFEKFSRYVTDNYNTSRIAQWFSIFSNSFRYNISILEYYLFNFYALPKQKKSSFAGTGYMYEYQLLMNPKSSREILNDKLIFLRKYEPFVKHNFISVNELSDTKKLNKVLNNPTGKIVLKDSKGQCGEGVLVMDSKKVNSKDLEEKLLKSGNDFVEDFIRQHDKLNNLSPSGLNTVRIITQLTNKGDVEILGARLRISINSSVDNLAAGNMAAPVNMETGIVEGMGVFSDITKKPLSEHPITKVQIVGFQIPFWTESVQMVTEAALLHKENRSIGWDVAITNNGPDLLEGNHDWCKLLWQLPVQKGLKGLLEKHKNEYLRNK